MALIIRMTIPIPNILYMIVANNTSRSRFEVVECVNDHDHGRKVHEEDIQATQEKVFSVSSSGTICRHANDAYSQIEQSLDNSNSVDGGTLEAEERDALWYSISMVA